MQRLPRIPKAVLFDMDGLIFDTEALYRDATIAAAQHAGVDLPLSAYLQTVGLPASRVRALLLELFDNEARLDEFWTHASEMFTQMALTDLRTKPGLRELLAFLETERIPKAIVTSSRRATVETHLKTASLHDRFQVIVANGDYLMGKPNAAPYLLAAERLGLSIGECVAIEDSQNGVASCSSAGAMTVMVPDLLEPTPDVRGRCEFVLSDLHAVQVLIANSLANGIISQVG